MTLIPMMSVIIATPRATAVAAGGEYVLRRSVYDPGARHRPLAAALAVGLPVALVVAVALSPMIAVIREASDPTVIKTVPLPTPTPPEPATASDPLPAPPPTAPVPRVDVPPIVPVDLKPLPPVKLPPTIGGGTTTLPPADPPAPPKFILAQLDQRFAGAFQPDYPASEQRRGIEGVVKVRVLIGTDGRVKVVEQIRSDSPGFFAETRRRALSKWRFKPATRGGVAEESWQVMTVRFQIRNA